MAPLSVPLHTSSIILCNLLEYPVLDRAGTPKEGVEGEGDGLLPEPTADVLDPPAYPHDTIGKLTDQVFEPVVPKDTVGIGEGNIVPPGMLDTDLACTADSPVILIHHCDREPSGDFPGGVDGVPIDNKDLVGLQGLGEEGLKASGDLRRPIANRDDHRDSRW
jgi:hypothetical protein